MNKNCGSATVVLTFIGLASWIQPLSFHDWLNQGHLGIQEKNCFYCTMPLSIPWTSWIFICMGIRNQSRDTGDCICHSEILCVRSLQLCLTFSTPWAIVQQVQLSMEFLRTRIQMGSIPSSGIFLTGSSLTFRVRQILYRWATIQWNDISAMAQRVNLAFCHSMDETSRSILLSENKSYRKKQVPWSLLHVDQNVEVCVNKKTHRYKERTGVCWGAGVRWKKWVNCFCFLFSI